MVYVVHVIWGQCVGKFMVCVVHVIRNKGDSVWKFMVCVVHVIRGTVCVEIYGLCGTRNKGTVCVEIYGLCGARNKGDSVCGNLWFVWCT